jgi:hypothetical protein
MTVSRDAFWQSYRLAAELLIAWSPGSPGSPGSLCLSGAHFYCSFCTKTTHYCTRILVCAAGAQGRPLLHSATTTQGVSRAKITRPRRSSNRRGYVVVWLRRSGAEEIACLRQIATLLTANPRRPLARANTCHRSAKAREAREDGEACGESLPLPPWTGIFLCHGTANTSFKVLDGDGLLSVLTSQPALRCSSLSSIVIVSSL